METRPIHGFMLFRKVTKPLGSQFRKASRRKSYLSNWYLCGASSVAPTNANLCDDLFPLWEWTELYHKSLYRVEVNWHPWVRINLSCRAEQTSQTRICLPGRRTDLKDTNLYSIESEPTASTRIRLPRRRTNLQNANILCRSNVCQPLVELEWKMYYNVWFTPRTKEEERDISRELEFTKCQYTRQTGTPCENTRGFRPKRRTNI